MAVSLKVLFIKTGKNAAEDIRRVTIPAAEAKTAPFDYLCAHIRNTNALDKAAPLTAKYKDEEDEWITVSSNVELSDAISTATPQRPLRLFVAPATADVNFAALPVPATPAGASTAQLTASPLSASTVSVLPAPAPAAAAPAPLSLPVTTPDAKAAIKAEPSPAPAPVAAAEKAAEAAPAAAPAAVAPAPSSVSSLAGKDEDDGFVHVAMNASILKPASPQAAAPAAAPAPAPAAEPAKVDTPKVDAAPAPAPEKVDTPKAEEVVAPAKAEPKASPVPAAEAPAPAVAAPTVTPVIAAVVAAEPTPAPTPAPKAEKPAVAAPAPVAEVAAPAPAPVQTAKVIPLTLSDSLMDLPKTAPAPTIVNKVAAPAPALAPAAPAPAPAATTPAPAVKAEAAAPAPAKAAAPAVAVHTGVSCDGCGAKPITGIRYNCITCANFDLCAKCESDPKKHPVTHAMLKIRQPIDYSALHKSSAATTKPTNSGTAAPATAAKPAPKAEFKAEYVSDVTIPDGSKVSPGASLHKVWKVKNFGAAPWPAGTALAFVGGEVAPSQPQPTDLVSVPTAKPGECVDVGLYLRMPEKAGRHTGYYRLQLPANASSTGAAQQFGSRMWVDVLVVPPQEMPNAPAPDVTVFATAVIPPALAPNAAATPSADAKATPAPAPAPAAAKQNAPAPAAPAPAPAPVSNYKYARELEELNAMGFTDKELVMYLLSNNSGDVGRVVNWMLQNAH